MWEEAFIYPLSFAQRRLWFLDQLAPGTPYYNLSGSLHLQFPVDEVALERSLDALAKRHDSLRTTFALLDGEPVQVVRPSTGIPCRVIDLRDVLEEHRWAGAHQLAQSIACLPFILTKGPLCHVTLARLSLNEHLLIVSMHHIISDAWSMGIFLRELNELYRSFFYDQPSMLPELPIQYGDFAVWERERLNDSRVDVHIQYWQEALHDMVPLELPLDRPRPQHVSFRAKRTYRRISASLTATLHEVSRGEGVTSFMFALAAFQTLMSRYAGIDDVAVAVPVTGRNREELEPLIGFFVNTVVMRLDCAGDPTVRELLVRVRTMAISAYSNQELPFEKLVEVLKPERHFGRNPLCQVMFQMQTESTKDDMASSFELDRGASNFDLVVSLLAKGDEIHTVAEFNTDIFNIETIEKLLAHYEILLEGMIRAPETPVTQLRMLPDEERCQLLYAWNRTETRCRPTPCLHSLVEQYAACSPDVIAISQPNGLVGYGELNRRANWLAHYLIEHGVQKEDIVAVTAGHDVETVVALLAVMKAGGCYLPLDKDTPVERLRFIVEDSRPRLVIDLAGLFEKTCWLAVERLDLGPSLDTCVRQSDINPISSDDFDSLAYMIYTSGSSGKPKGVLLEHRGLGNIIAAQGEMFDVRPSDRILQFASLGFDASMFEIAMALGHGARLCMASKSLMMPGHTLEKCLDAYGVTIAVLPPSALLMPPESPLATLRVLMVAGEACPADVVRAWAPGRRFFNLYGPTEGTIWSTAAECSASEEEPVPIGHPIANVRAYILDRGREPCPVGVVGELYISGLGLARGYLNRPKLNEERFLVTESGERLYRTGDLARRCRDGSLIFVGRVDHQVKLRGFRIELGEIEAALRSHESIRDTVVVLSKFNSSDHQLIAYVASDTRVESSILHRFLATSLPGYMIPSHFVWLDALPLTASGKVDRRALPAVDRMAITIGRKRLAPRTETEATLTAMWSQVLGVDDVGVFDDFFHDLEGHSLLATQLVARIRSELGIDLPVREVFVASSVALMAEAIDLLKSASDEHPHSSQDRERLIGSEGTKVSAV